MELNFIKFRQIAVVMLKAGYCIAGFVVFWLYFTQDEGSRHQLAFLRSFVLAFPASLLADFFIIAPLVFFDYVFDGYFSRALQGEFFGNCFVFAIGLINFIVGYRQWFITFPTLVRRFFCKFMPPEG